jgi:hypothetical protein
MVIPYKVRDYAHQALRRFHKRRRQHRKQIAAAAIVLERQLFGGYSVGAERGLIDLSKNHRVSPAVRSRAFRALASWNTIQGNPERALEYLRAMRRVSPETYQLLAPFLREADLCRKTGKLKDALLALQSARDVFGECSDLFLHMANVSASAAPPNLADETRLEWLNRPFVSAALAPLERIDASARLSFYNLAAPSALPTNSDVAKLSVLVPAYNCAQTLPVALRSILWQTWRNLEIIVVDDASTDSTPEIVEQIGRTDHRVKLIRQPTNSGAYNARNAALDCATGEFITVHDADDWSHPQKFEAQLTDLLQDNSVFNCSFAARVADDMVLDTRRTNALVENISSMMIRRATLKELGYWHEVRFAADSELRERVEAKTKCAPVKIHPTVPLSFLLTSTESISGQSTTGLMSIRYGARKEYRSFYRRWHEREAQAKSPRWRIGRGEHPFPVAEVQLQKNSRVRAPILLVSDFACEENQPTNEFALRAISQVSGSASFHWPHPKSAQLTINPDLIDLMHEHWIRPVVCGDTVECDILLISDLSLFSETPDLLPSVKAKRIVVVDPRVRVGERTTDILAVVRSVWEVEENSAEVLRPAAGSCDWIDPHRRQITELLTARISETAER